MNDPRDLPEARACLFLHGVFGRPRDFDAVASALKGRGRTLAPPLPIAVSGGAVENTTGLCRLVEKKLDEESVGRALLVGTALGGHVAIAFALKHPVSVSSTHRPSSSGARTIASRRQTSPARCAAGSGAPGSSSCPAAGTRR